MKIFPLLISILLLISCSGNKNKNKNQLVLFHAGSLSVPVKQMCVDFKKENPDVEILTEISGSVDCARKITDLNRSCDLILVSDYKVIDQMLVPEHASWNIRFASNSLVIAFNQDSKLQMDSVNWYNLLLNPSVKFGRSNPDSDPCGYRTVFLFQLAEKHYHQSGLAEKLLAKDIQFIRPKEVDLLALLEARAIDCFFIYRSVAVQHQLAFIELPLEVNLSLPAYDSLYSLACANIAANRPGETRQVCGEAIVYGLSIPKNAQNPALAQKFASFVLNKDHGLKTMAENGQPPIVPDFCTGYDSVPAILKQFVKP